MPDWIVHIGVVYIICRILYVKYDIFNHPNTSLAMIGSLIPDIVKLGMITEYFGLDLWDYLLVFHLPLTSLIVAALFSLFFCKKKIVMGLLTLGLCTHFVLDLLLINIGAGIYLFFPLNWQTFHFDIISPDDYYLSMITLTVAFLVFAGGYCIKKYKNNE